MSQSRPGVIIMRKDILDQVLDSEWNYERIYGQIIIKIDYREIITDFILWNKHDKPASYLCDLTYP